MLCDAQFHVLKSVDEQLQQIEMVNFILGCYVWAQPLITVFEACNKSPRLLVTCYIWSSLFVYYCVCHAYLTIMKIVTFNCISLRY